jgi:hypothetical protein
MSGERDLGRLLRGLAPSLDDTPFAFGVLPKGAELPRTIRLIGLFEEDEGTTLIAPLADLSAAGIEHSAAMAKISLKVHSSLEAVGLTAAIAAALAEAGISANIVAAYYHDHVFVPWDRREEALSRLRALSTGEAPA